MRLLHSHPVLAVHDLETSAAWYEAVLGCTRDDVDPGNWVFCRSGKVRFMLGRCPDALPASAIGDHSYVAYLDVDDVDRAYARAVEASAEVLKPPTDEPWGRREICLRSPDGHRFMLGNVLSG
ncbi:MAG TPA: VOC family protein [Acidimicrobiia bacterium]|nr:VOC family protein [Acidimicrobiia bacterium]